MGLLVAALLALLAGIAARHGSKLLWHMPFPAPHVVDVPAANRPAPIRTDPAYAPNAALHNSQQLFRGIQWPETPLVLENGTVYVASVATGQLVRSSIHQPQSWEHVAWLGSPAGMVLHPDGYLVVCDMTKGLLAVDPSSGAVQLLATRLSNASLARPRADIRFCDDIDVSRKSGKIYFSDASRIPVLPNGRGELDPLASSLLTLLQGSPTGRLLAYDPRTRTTELLVNGIFFANGVALSEDESYVLVVETFGMHVLRHWLAGPKAGTTDVFLEGLPAFPDGISRAPGGRSYWVALVTPATPLVRQLPSSRRLRWLVAWMPEALKPKALHYGWVAEVSADGRLLRTLHDPTGKACHTISSAVQVGTSLYMGSMGASHVCKLNLTAAGAAPARAGKAGAPGTPGQPGAPGALGQPGTPGGNATAQA